MPGLTGVTSMCRRSGHSKSPLPFLCYLTPLPSLSFWHIQELLLSSQVPSLFSFIWAGAVLPKDNGHVGHEEGESEAEYAVGKNGPRW